MLSEPTVAYLSALTYRADAKRLFCFLPLGGIYWEDELPDLRDLAKLSQDDRQLIWRLFAIRLKIWHGGSLSDDDRRFWHSARSQVPNYPLFCRLEPSLDDRRAQEEAERNVTEQLEALFADADRVEISENKHGFQFSATFDLTKGQAPVAKQSWWKRVFRKSGT